MRLRRQATGWVAASLIAAPAALAGQWANTQPDDERSRALHVLNRLTHGPRPGDVDAVLAVGIEAFIETQLAAGEDADLERFLSRFPVTSMSSADLGEIFVAAQRDRRRRQQTMTADNQSAVTPRPDQRAGQSEPDPRGVELRQRLTEFQQVTLLRAIRSDRQLQEVMVDFWTNHFNVFSGKGQVRYLIKDHVDDVIRPRAMGRFEDLLLASAQSPAMLYYLDNSNSVRAGAEPPPLQQARQRVSRMQSGMVRGRARPGQSQTRAQSARLEQAREQLRVAEERMPRGLNENYARELLELHTLGVDGGYTQADVENVARILTGWSVDGLGRGGSRFVFNSWAHDTGPKVVLDQEYAAGGGMEEGVRLIRYLARHAATIRHVTGKLCERFVAEPAPEGCIESGFVAWRSTDGDVRQVLRAIFSSPDFWAVEHRNTKIKTPLEFVVSSVRALNVMPDSAAFLLQFLRRLGQPLYGAEAPTGYPEEMEEWVNAGALLNRLSLSVAFASGRLPQLSNLDDAIPLSESFDEMMASVNRAVLNNTASPNTLRVMAQRAGALDQPEAQRVLLIGLALGSPEFQRQ